ncbi:hypothetical protein Asp14428_47570 [Actinoplanes sp. NBRC 14428]|nr:hypothetical protein Asp14428_47570 [Actinoplanes sp. NBRC 14428]
MVVGALGAAFQVGAHYAEVLGYAEQRRAAARLGDSYDVRGVDADRVIVRVDAQDAGSYGHLSWLDPREPAGGDDADFSRRVEQRLRESFGLDSRVAVAVVDGRPVGLTIDGAVRGIRRTLEAWRRQGRDVGAGQRMIVFTGDGGSVGWRGDSGDINVSA